MEKKFYEFIQEFENNLLGYEFKKYKLSDKQFVYDIENSNIISILLKKEDNRIHIIVEEIFNDHTRNIKLSSFCKKYIKTWVSFYPFYNELGLDNPFKGKSQYEYINKALPELKIDERYKNWKGYSTCYAIFQLIEGRKKGYAVARYSKIGGITELRKIGEDLTNSYIDSKNREKNNSEYVYGKNNFIFLIDKNMCEILEKRYFSKFKLPKLSDGFAIPDLKGNWNYGYSKLEEDIPFEELTKIKERKFQKENTFQNLYTESMKNSITKYDDLNKDYIYASVEYVDTDRNYYTYYYLCDDESIKVGDKVLVNRAGKETIAIVENIEKYKGYEVPYSIAKTRTIIKKIETEEELEKYGFTEEDFKDYYDDDEEDDDSYHPYYSYYIITTLSDNKEIIQNISKELLEEKLIAGSQISEVVSNFWWEGKVQSKKEYKLEMRTRNDKLDTIAEFIKSNHNYITPEISATIIQCLTDDMRKWIDDILDNKF